MNPRRFFALLWRINAVLILVAGILAVVALGFAVVMMLNSTRSQDGDALTQAVFPDDNKAATLGAFEAVPGTDVLRARLNVGDRPAFGSGSRYADSTVRNYLFVDPESRNAHWLRPSMEGVFLHSINLPESGFNEKPPDVRLFVYTLVERDTNGDRQLTEADSKTIAVSDPAGKRFRIVVTGADELRDSRLLRSDRLLVLYSAGAKLMAAELNPFDAGSSGVETYELPIAQR